MEEISLFVSICWSIFWLIMLLLLLSILDTAYVLLIVTTFSCSLLLFFPLRVLLMSTSDRPLYYFSAFRSESWYRELFVDHTLVQLFSSEFSFLSWLVLFRYSGWYCLWFYFSYMWFYPCAWFYMHIYVLYCSLLTA